MGGEYFEHIAMGKTADEAFDAAVESAQHDYGHAGYTGTIAEKDEFVMVRDASAATQDDAKAFADKLMDDRDPRVDDKWGPAGCIKIGEPDESGQQAFLFFGVANS